MIILIGGTSVLLCVALLAYGREELGHGDPDKRLYIARTEALTSSTDPHNLVHVRNKYYQTFSNMLAKTEIYLNVLIFYCYICMF